MDSDHAKELCLSLIRADSDEEVTQSLRDAGFWDNAALDLRHVEYVGLRGDARGSTSPSTTEWPNHAPAHLLVERR
jgi:hypothetical protein